MTSKLFLFILVNLLCADLLQSQLTIFNSLLFRYEYGKFKRRLLGIAEEVSSVVEDLRNKMKDQRYRKAFADDPDFNDLPESDEEVTPERDRKEYGILLCYRRLYLNETIYDKVPDQSQFSFIWKTFDLWAEINGYEREVHRKTI